MSITSGVDTQSTRTVVPLTGEYPLARVDLMPAEVLADRRFARARGWMALAVVGAVGVSGAAFFFAEADADAAAADLAAERAVTAELEAEAARYAQVPAILASVDRAETALQTAMATDVEWYRYVSQIGSVSPEGVWFTTITLTSTPGDGATGGDPLAPADAIGDVTTVGRALSYGDVAAWMDNLEGVTGLDHVLFSTATYDADSAAKPFVDFQVSATLLSEAYSDRYVPEAE